MNTKAQAPASFLCRWEYTYSRSGAGESGNEATEVGLDRLVAKQQLEVA